ncbi:MAG: dienelactone hydrolase family protein [Deltaproteobacteria bacterium]|nr:dienelactone hydrolase family protein [Deltaproteobacteria bacterium]
MDGFEKTSFNGAFDVYQRGRGPGVLLLPELPGITPPVTALATRIAGEGFTVAIPHLFGPIAPFSNLGAAKTFLQLCVRKEFALLASHRASPITDTLRALSKQLHERCGGRGVGAIGLCMTGNFALTLMLDPWVLAPVVAHPGLPVPIGKRRKAGCMRRRRRSR